MMLRSLVNEVVRRRMAPILGLALLVIVAAPLLFMKSAPSGAPDASEAPPAAAPGKLPGSAEKLVTSSDKAVTPRHRSKSKKDPFAPPASTIQAAAAAANPAKPAATASASASKSSGAVKIPVVLTNPDGSKIELPKQKKATPKKSTPKSSSPVVSASKQVAIVNVRFAATKDSKLRRGVPRLKTFQAGGKVAAMFVKYSPARSAAVFAVAPSTKVSGLDCRRKEGVCRYVDIPAGKSVLLTLRGKDGSIISRRLDVVSIKRVSEATAAATVPSAIAKPTSTNALAEATCMLKSLLALPAILPSLSVDACE
jgi:hypothetical protein